MASDPGQRAVEEHIEVYNEDDHVIVHCDNRQWDSSFHSLMQHSPALEESCIKEEDSQRRYLDWNGEDPVCVDATMLLVNGPAYNALAVLQSVGGVAQPTAREVLSLHIRVAILADKYGLTIIHGVAHTNFYNELLVARMQNRLSVDEVADVAKEAYTAPDQATKAITTTIANYVALRRGLMREPSIIAAMHAFPDFPTDVA